MSSQSALPAQSPWNHKQLLVALAIAFILQSLLLPCLCSIGTAKMKLAYALDGLVLLRIGVSYMRRGAGGGWKFYAILLYTSPVWIQGIAYIVFGDT